VRPKLVMCNIFDELSRIKDFAFVNGFDGIDWSFDLKTLPRTPMEESRWAGEQARLAPFEVRYHCPFFQIDLGHDDPEQAKKADDIFRRIIRMVSRAGGKLLSIHIGLGHHSTEPLSWETTIANLRNLVRFGADHQVKVCLENLAWGWTSKPNLFEKLIRLSGAGITFDIGHARVCESVLSQQYAVEDFVTPHEHDVLNAHVYHEEISGQGHMPPQRMEDIASRLDLLARIGCPWWVIEIKEPEPLLNTKRIIDAYLARRNGGRAVIKAV
jgi:sugar phosphate isomerase/epimerase